MTPERPALGQIAFEAWNRAARVGGMVWDDLSPSFRDAWTAAATAAVEATPTRPLPPATPGPRLSTPEERALADDRRAFWLPIIAPGGVVDVEQVLLELGDFSHVMTEVPKVYDAITNGRMSKCTYFAGDVISVYEAEVTDSVHAAETEVLIEIAQLFADVPTDVALICSFAEDYGIPDLAGKVAEQKALQARLGALVGAGGENQ